MFAPVAATSKLRAAVVLNVIYNFPFRMITAHLNEFAQVLVFMKQGGLLQQFHFRHAVGALVRASMETPYPYCTTNYRSLMAQEVVVMHAPRTAARYHSLCRTLRHEHMVPTNVRIAILVDMENPTEESVAQSLRTFGLRATLHVDEDRILDSAGLRLKMPDSFWDSSNREMYMNPLARYIETGLINNLVQRHGDCWFAVDHAAGLYPIGPAGLSEQSTKGPVAKQLWGNALDAFIKSAHGRLKT